MNYNGYLILTDIDGTLTPRAGEVSAENAEAIEYFKKNGGLFTFATGRMPEYLSRFPFRANAPIVTINGTLICDGEGRTLWQKPMAAKDCIPVIRHILDRYPCVKTVQRCSQHPDRLAIDFLPPEESLLTFEDGCPTYKIVFICEAEKDALLLRKDLTEHFGDAFSYDRSWPVGLEMHDSASGKGACIDVLRQMLPHVHTVITVGDYENDVTMLRAADIGCAVANALPSVKAAADREIVHCDDHAIAHIIYELIPSLPGHENV